MIQLDIRRLILLLMSLTIVNNVSTVHNTALTSDGSININLVEDLTIHITGVVQMVFHLLIKILVIYFLEIIFEIIDSKYVFYDTIVVESVQPCGIGFSSFLQYVTEINGKIIVNSVLGILILHINLRSKTL